MTLRTRNILIGIIAFLVLIIIGLLAWFLLRSTSNTSTNTGVATSTAATTSQTGPTSFTGPIHLTEHQQYYDVDLQYPSQTPLAASAGAQADAKAVATMKAFSQQQRDTFVSQGDYSNPAAQQQYAASAGSQALSDTYKTYTSPNTISYEYDIYEDTGGAHPNTYFQTFTFDRKTGALLGLADVFTPGSDYLTQLSKISRTQLVNGSNGFTADDPMLVEGTQPTADNFQNFVLDGSNLVILFPPYQVAAYAAGTQTVKIPLSEISSILRANYK